MFETAAPKTRLRPRSVVIELRDGRTFRGVLQLPTGATAGGLLQRAGAFMTIKTSKGEIAFARDLISAMILGDEADEAASFQQAQQKKSASAGAKTSEHRHEAYYGNDPCRVLGVRPGASRDELKEAWRERIKRCHPDAVRARGAADDVIMAAQREAARVNTAYRTLVAMRGRA